MIPSGLIAIWQGALIDIPAGWVLCDGNNGTPNLEATFVRGAGDFVAVGGAGGASTHRHDFTTDGHQHTLPAGTQLAAGAVHNSTSSNNQDTGQTDITASLPPFYNLAYIMKT